MSEFISKAEKKAKHFYAPLAPNHGDVFWFSFSSHLFCCEFYIVSRCWKYSIHLMLAHILRDANGIENVQVRRKHKSQPETCSETQWQWLKKSMRKPSQRDLYTESGATASLTLLLLLPMYWCQFSLRKYSLLRKLLNFYNLIDICNNTVYSIHIHVFYYFTHDVREKWSLYNVVCFNLRTEQNDLAWKWIEAMDVLMNFVRWMLRSREGERERETWIHENVWMMQW